MTVMKFDKVCKTFYTKQSETIAVQDLTFEVNKGEFVAIIGPSGCGKTTILSLVCGLIQPTSGKIVMADGAKVGYMLQRDHLFEWRTVWKNITLGPEIQHTASKMNTDKAERLLATYGLTEFRNSYPQQLSGGMRQRVALIRTLATNPDILLLDEPFSALDFQTRLDVCDDVYRIIRSEQKTALLVTHDISEAISMADKIVVLTKRPAHVLTVHETKLGSIPTPLKRRESPTFARQFELLHSYLQGGAV